MNQELQKQLADLLAKLASTVENGASWAGSQIPPLVQEKIALGRIETTVFFCLALAAIAAPIVAWRAWRRHEWSDAEDSGFAAFGCGCVTMLWLFAFSVTGHECLMAWVAPRIYIVEWLKGMVQ